MEQPLVARGPMSEYLSCKTDEEGDRVLERMLDSAKDFGLALYVWKEAKDSRLKARAFERSKELALGPLDWANIWVNSSRGSDIEREALDRLQDLDGTANFAIPPGFALSSLVSACPA